MSRISMGLSLLSLSVFGLLASPVSAQDNTAALKAKILAKEKLAPAAKAKPQPKPKAAANAQTRKTPAAKPQPKSLQQQADELQVKSNALSSLTELLTDRRARCQKRVEMMTAYLKSVGKLRDYENAKTPAPTKKGEMTFRHAVNTAVKHAKTRGGTCVDNPDQAEVSLLRRIYSANNRLAKKTWNEYAALRGRIQSMGAYLDSINKTDDYKKWAGVEVDKQKQAFEQKMQADRMKQVAAYKTKRARRQQEQKQEAQKIAAQQRQDRQQALQQQFQLRQQQLYNQMRENSSPSQWCGWDDQYNDTYCPRQY